MVALLKAVEDIRVNECVFNQCRHDGTLVGGERIKLQVFEMSSMASGGAYHRAFTYATQPFFHRG
jgi:hypothetical protein